MRFLLSLVLVALIAVGIYWYLKEGRQQPRVRQAEQELVAGAERVRDSIQDKLGEFSLKTDDIKGDLARSGGVIRRQTRELGSAIADATANARVSAAIKGKLIADPDLSALRISVDTTDGIVTLAGSVSSHEQIGRAMLLALETEGVREVVSTLQVKQQKTIEPTDHTKTEPTPSAGTARKGD